MRDLTFIAGPACHRTPAAAPLHCTAGTDMARQDRAFCIDIGRRAVRSLHAELMLYPKPGLVSPVDNGSHDDMTAATFMRSLFSLRHYFIRITGAGMNDAPFSILKSLGLEAERRMLLATNGINTHRGAIFCLGLLCAAIGRCRARCIALSAAGIRAELLARWGDALVEHMQSAEPDSHGLRAAALHSASGAREEAALGLPSLFEVALPAFEKTLRAGRGWNNACIDALFSLMSHISDTNIYHRAGAEGAVTVKFHARRFLAMGATGHPEWKAYAIECHRIFVDRNLSPGGAADLLAATCLVHEVITRYQKNK
jgi:triphosphoribosyl-dephospho-CoA synthase